MTESTKANDLKPTAKPAFEVGDLDILVKVVSLHPELEATAAAIKLARAHVKYPISSYDSLKEVFRTGRATFGRYSVAFEDVPKYLHKQFLPIAAEDQLVSAVLTAFMIRASQPSAGLSAPIVAFPTPSADGQGVSQ